MYWDIPWHKVLEIAIEILKIIAGAVGGGAMALWGRHHIKKYKKEVRKEWLK